jgi:hypothetical protein
MDLDEIVNQDVCQFEFEEEDFYVEFSEGKWIAASNDPEIEDLIIIESSQEGIFMTEPIELFGNFVLTQELFNQYKLIIGEKIL